jgi:hypothetical protein
MPIDVWFRSTDELAGEYELRTEQESFTVWVAVPGELDLTFAQGLYNDSELVVSAARSTNVARFAARLSRLFAQHQIATRISTR